LWHKSTGYFTVIAGLVNVTLGVFLIIPPLAVWVVWLVALLVWVIVFCIYETIHLLKYVTSGCVAHHYHMFLGYVSALVNVQLKILKWLLILDTNTYCVTDYILLCFSIVGLVKFVFYIFTVM